MPVAVKVWRSPVKVRSGKIKACRILTQSNAPKKECVGYPSGQREMKNALVANQGLAQPSAVQRSQRI
jgi:hypothetical protein